MISQIFVYGDDSRVSAINFLYYVIRVTQAYLVALVVLNTKYVKEWTESVKRTVNETKEDDVYTRGSTLERNLRIQILSVFTFQKYMCISI